MSRSHLSLAMLAFAVCAACGTATPGPRTSQDTPTPTSSSETFPLAVVTGLTNERSSITVDYIQRANELLVPCEAKVITPEIYLRDCSSTTEIMTTLQEQPNKIALLPPGLVTPRLKVLPVEGADIFGDAKARAVPYPVVATSTAIGEDLQVFLPDRISRVMMIGDVCPTGVIAKAVADKGLGWSWVFDGGTVKYSGVKTDPDSSGRATVQTTPASNSGAFASLVSSADITVMQLVCPIAGPDDVDEGSPLTATTKILGPLASTWGVDAAAIATDHQMDAGAAGVVNSIGQLKSAKIKPFGAGKNQAQALAPAFFKANGTRFAYVAFNAKAGAASASASGAGVASLVPVHVQAAVQRASEDADVVICVPRWDGGKEHHADMTASQRTQEKQLLDAGCQHILGHGTRWAGPLNMMEDEAGVHVTVASHGNALWGETDSREGMEGVVSEIIFHGAAPVQVRLHPYFTYQGSQPNLIAPGSDGAPMLRRIHDKGVIRL